MADIFYSSIFGELTKQVQIRIDAASELRKRLFDQNIYERYLTWDVPTIGLNFEELVGQYNLSVAAATLDSSGKSPLMGTEGLETLKDKVLNHQMAYSMPIEDYRKILQILDSRMLTDRQKTQQLIELMWGNVTKVVNSVQSKLDMIFLGALFPRRFVERGRVHLRRYQQPRRGRARHHRLQDAGGEQGRGDA